MHTLNLGEMQKICTRESGNNQLTPDQVYVIINRVIREICGTIYADHMEDSWSFSTVADQAEYKLPPNYSKRMWLRNTTSGNKLTLDPVTNKEEWFETHPDPDNENTAPPAEYLIHGSDKTGIQYSTGTATVAEGSRTWSFSSAAAIITAGALPGSIVTDTKNNVRYNISSVDSETGLTTVQKSKFTLTAEDYEIEHIYNQKMRLHPVPDAVYTMVLEYYRSPSPMVSPKDFPEIHGDFVDAAIHMTIREMRKYDEDSTLYIIEQAETEKWMKMYATRNEDELDDGERIKVDRFGRFA